MRASTFVLFRQKYEIVIIFPPTEETAYYTWLKTCGLSTQVYDREKCTIGDLQWWSLNTGALKDWFDCICVLLINEVLYMIKTANNRQQQNDDGLLCDCHYCHYRQRPCARSSWIQEHSESADLLGQGSSSPPPPPPYCSHIAQITPQCNQLFLCTANLKISSKSASKLLSNGQIFNWTVSIVIWITTKIQSLVTFTTPDPSVKCHCNPLVTFWVILLIDKHT